MAQETAERIYELLGQCLSAENDVRTAAEAKLREAEQKPDYFASLAMIVCAAEGDVEPQVRWLAAVCGKNAVRRCWRKHSGVDTVVSEEERDYVRGALLSAIGTAQTNLAVQLSVWISLVARMDYPRSWPTVVDELVAKWSSNEPATVCHALVTADMVFKQLASRRMMADRRAFASVVRELYPVVLRMFESHLAALRSLPPEQAHASPSFTVVERCMKSMRRFIIFGMDSIEGSKEVERTFEILVQDPALFAATSAQAAPIKQRLSLLAAKLVHRAHERHPVDFHVYLPHMLRLYGDILLSFDAENSSHRLGFHSARFIRNVYQCVDYKIDRGAIVQFAAGALPSATPTEKARVQVLSFFNPSWIRTFVGKLLTGIFRLTSAELRTWDEDPEMLVREEDAAEWTGESVRFECEEVLRTILLRNKDFVVNCIQEVSAASSSDPLLRDACYRAIGKCMYEVEDGVPFEQWLNSELVPILSAPLAKDVGSRVVKARAAWLSGQFVSSLSRPARKLLYSLLVPLMTLQNNDGVIALTAAKALQMLVEDLGFIGSDIAPYLRDAISRTLEMSAQCESVDTKRELLDFAASLVARSPTAAVSEAVDHLSITLPAMWRQARNAAPSAVRREGTETNAWNADGGGENLHRTAVVLLLTSVVRKLGEAAVASHVILEVVLDAIEYGTDLSGNDCGGVYMMDEACDLWEATVSACAQLPQGLAVLYPRVHDILSNDFDNMKVLFRIVEGYAMLGGMDFIQCYGEALVGVFEQALQSMKDRGCLTTCDVIDLLLQLFPTQGPALFASLLRGCATAAASGNESRVVSAAYVGLVLRSALSNIDVVEATVLGGSTESIRMLLELGIKNIDNMYLSSRRKMAALALCGLCRRAIAKDPRTVEFAVATVNVSLQVVQELESDRRAPGRDMRGSDFDNMISRGGETEDDAAERIESCLGANMPGDLRRKALADKDIAVTTDLSVAIKALLEAVQKCDEQVVRRFAELTDPATSQALQNLPHS